MSRLALAPEAQVAYLEQIGTAPSADELALEFDDSMHLVSQLREAGWLEPNEVTLLETIDDCLDHMSGQANAALWKQEVLASAPEWATVRGLAQQFLFEQGNVVRIFDTPDGA